MHFFTLLEVLKLTVFMKIQFSELPYGIFYVINLREKFSPEAGYEPRSPALRGGELPTTPPRPGRNQKFS